MKNFYFFISSFLCLPVLATQDPVQTLYVCEAGPCFVKKDNQLGFIKLKSGGRISVVDSDRVINLGLKSRSILKFPNGAETFLNTRGSVGVLRGRLNISADQKLERPPNLSEKEAAEKKDEKIVDDKTLTSALIHLGDLLITVKSPSAGAKILAQKFPLKFPLSLEWKGSTKSTLTKKDLNLLQKWRLVRYQGEKKVTPIAVLNLKSVGFGSDPKSEGRAIQDPDHEGVRFYANMVIAKPGTYGIVPMDNAPTAENVRIQFFVTSVDQNLRKTIKDSLKKFSKDQNTDSIFLEQ